MDLDRLFFIQVHNLLIFEDCLGFCRELWGFALRFFCCCLGCFGFVVYGLLVFWWAGGFWGGFLQGAEDERCELVCRVPVTASLRFAGGLLLCAGGQACFARLKNELSLPTTRLIETNNNCFGNCSELCLTLLICKLKQPNKTQNLLVRISTYLFLSRASLCTSLCSSSQGDTRVVMPIFVNRH